MERMTHASIFEFIADFHLLATMNAIPPNMTPKHQKAKHDRTIALVIETLGARGTNRGA